MRVRPCRTARPDENGWPSPSPPAEGKLRSQHVASRDRHDRVANGSSGRARGRTAWPRRPTSEFAMVQGSRQGGGPSTQSACAAERQAEADDAGERHQQPHTDGLIASRQTGASSATSKGLGVESEWSQPARCCPSRTGFAALETRLRESMAKGERLRAGWRGTAKDRMHQRGQKHPQPGAAGARPAEWACAANSGFQCAPRRTQRKGRSIKQQRKWGHWSA